MCLQQIYGGGKYKDCNDLPIGESAIAFSSALNKPDSNIYFIFCIFMQSFQLSAPQALRHDRSHRDADILRSNDS